MKELSIFIDESGDFGETRDIRDYYLVTFVFHDQTNDITENTINKALNGIKQHVSGNYLIAVPSRY